MIASNTPKVVLVTGASSGFGYAIAKALAAKNYRVFGTARAAQSGAASDGFTTLTLDVTQDVSVAACVSEVLRTAGRIDAVINNAGIGIAGAIEDTNSHLGREVLAVAGRTSFQPFGRSPEPCRSLLLTMLLHRLPSWVAEDFLDSTPDHASQ